MPNALHTVIGSSSHSSAIILVALVLVSFFYVLGRRRMQRMSAGSIPAWHAASFIFGLSLIWTALASPLVAYEHDLLTVHMIQHLLLMTFAPALILLGEPLLVFLHGLPRLRKIVPGPLFRRPLALRFGQALSRPALCWIVSAVTLLGWHVPALFTLGMRSE